MQSGLGVGFLLVFRFWYLTGYPNPGSKCIALVPNNKMKSKKVLAFIELLSVCDMAKN